MAFNYPLSTNFQGNCTKFLWHLLPCRGLALGPVPGCRVSVKGKISLYQRNFGAIALDQLLKKGAPWFRRGRLEPGLQAEVLRGPRKTRSNKTNANDYEYAMAA